MKRLIKKSNNDLDKIICDLSDYLSKGINSNDRNSALTTLIDNLLKQLPSVEASGNFYRGLILNYDLYDFREKMPKVNKFANEAENFMDDNDVDSINEKQKEYKDTPIPSDLIEEMKVTCISEIKRDDNYYSFAKTFEACKNFIFDAAPSQYDGDIYVIFECDTSGLDIEKLNNEINDLDISDNSKNKFLEAYRNFGYQKEVICKMTDINICQLQYLNFNENNSLYDLLINFGVDFYI